MRRRRHDEWNAVPEGDDTDHAVLQPLRAITDRFFARSVLLEVFGHHEVEEVVVLVEVLHVDVHDVGGLDRIARLPGLLDGTACFQVAHADAVEGLPFAGFDHLVLDDDEWVAIDEDFEAGLEFAGVVVTHGFCVLAR